MWLEQHEVIFTERDLLINPLSEAELIGLAKEGGINVTDLVNPKSQVFKKTGYQIKDLDDKKSIEILTDNPRILKRPIVTGPGKFITGFSEAVFSELL